MPFFFSRNPDTTEELKSIIMQSVAPKQMTPKIYPMRSFSWKRLWIQWFAKETTKIFFEKKIIQWVRSMLIKSKLWFSTILRNKTMNYHFLTPYNFRVFHDYYCRPSYFSRNPDTNEELNSKIMQSVAPKETVKIYPMRYLSWRRM